MIDLKQLKRDREQGTPGKWRKQAFFGNIYAADGITTHIATTSRHQLNGGEDEHNANMRRIARLPDLEAEYIALRKAADELAEAADWLRGAAPLGDYVEPQVSLDRSIVADVLSALAAYREALK